MYFNVKTQECFVRDMTTPCAYLLFYLSVLNAGKYLMTQFMQRLTITCFGSRFFERSKMSDKQLPETEISCECSKMLHNAKVSRCDLTKFTRPTIYFTGKYTKRIKRWDVWGMQHAKVKFSQAVLVGKTDISAVTSGGRVLNTVSSGTLHGAMN